MRRSEARELLMQMVFQMEAQSDFSDKAFDFFVQNNMEGSSQLDYFNKVYRCIAINRKEIDEKINAVAAGWKTTRMARVDLAVLRLCVAEILFLDESDIPQAASINEAVDLAKKFGGEASGKFVNGILGKLSESGE
ncbi:MAG: transcription antitermination factor NusB [Eubacteriales bacterium]|jgi:N utilization substance protein B|nr:transcription antitermination factor NusB [Eubacteriales bacterium]MDD3290239.1 transcription antitermination factor NusB [Eubacteriales bacterium]MDD3863293.1 transcription antitermination factor NusB [Eubacteriales bacterium]MDD4444458.1 transcription antitermination factor NusB [Eubacteriales bacterium]